MNKIFVYFIIIFLSNSFSCIKHNAMEKKIGIFVYNFSDSISEIVVSHKECTECLDGWVERGVLNIPPSMIEELNSILEKKGANFLPNGKDLYLIDANNNRIDDILFGNQDNYLDKWNDQYRIRGYVVAISDFGFVFRVENYKKTKDY